MEGRVAVRNQHTILLLVSMQQGSRRVGALATSLRTCMFSSSSSHDGGTVVSSARDADVSGRVSACVSSLHSPCPFELIAATRSTYSQSYSRHSTVTLSSSVGPRRQTSSHSGGAL